MDGVLADFESGLSEVLGHKVRLSDVADVYNDRKREVTSKLYHIKYPINDNNFIVISTTRPETMFGDTAVAVHPKDNRYIKYIGKNQTLLLAIRTYKKNFYQIFAIQYP